MENDFLHYFDQQLKIKMNPSGFMEGPLVTISREFGCPSYPIGKMLTHVLNKHMPRDAKLHKPEWRLVNKEILEQAARELQLKPIEFDHIVNSGEKGFMEDFIISFSKPYVNQHRIKHTMIRVVTTITRPGYVVLVGRGSSAILQDRGRSFHIRLMAPFGWRVEETQKHRGISRSEAEVLVSEVDQRRIALFELLLGRKFDLSLFDILFNCQRLSNEGIVQTVFDLMKEKKMV